MTRTEMLERGELLTSEDYAAINANKRTDVAILASKMDDMRRHGRNRPGRNAHIANVRRKMLNKLAGTQVNAVGKSRN